MVLSIYFIVLLSLYINLDTVMTFIVTEFRINEMVYSEDVRLKITENYIGSVENYKELLLGFPYDQQTSFYGGYTLHNSYINAHFRYGIFAIFIFLLIIRAIICGLRGKYLYIVLITSILVRGITDTTIIGENFDFIFFGLLASLLKLSRTNKTNKIN